MTSLEQYRLLGRSGLRVSPLALGTMTFGQDWATTSQVALAWTLSNPAVTAPMMGARTLAQAEDNLGALDVVLSDEQRARLDAASAPEPTFPARSVGRPLVQQLIFGGSSVARRI